MWKAQEKQSLIKLDEYPCWNRRRKRQIWNGRAWFDAVMILVDIRPCDPVLLKGGKESRAQANHKQTWQTNVRSMVFGNKEGVKDNSCVILILISSQQQGGKTQAEEVSIKRVNREPFPKMASTELSACSMFRMLQRSPRYSSQPHVSLQTCQMIMRTVLNEFRKQTTLWVVISAALRKCKTKMK